MSNKNKKACTTLNYTEHFLNLLFAVTLCIFVSAFASLINTSSRIMSYIKGLNIFATIVRIKKHNSIAEEKKKKQDKIAFLAETNLGCMKD